MQPRCRKSPRKNAPTDKHRRPSDCSAFDLPAIVTRRNACEQHRLLEEENRRWQRRVKRWERTRREEKYVGKYLPAGMQELTSEVIAAAYKEQPSAGDLWPFISAFMDARLADRTRSEIKTAIFYHLKLPCREQHLLYCLPEDQPSPHALQEPTEEQIKLPRFVDMPTKHDPDIRDRICQGDDEPDIDISKICEKNAVKKLDPDVDTFTSADTSEEADAEEESNTSAGSDANAPSNSDAASNRDVDAESNIDAKEDASADANSGSNADAEKIESTNTSHKNSEVGVSFDLQENEVDGIPKDTSDHEGNMSTASGQISKEQDLTGGSFVAKDGIESEYSSDGQSSHSTISENKNKE